MLDTAGMGGGCCSGYPSRLPAPNAEEQTGGSKSPLTDASQGTATTTTAPVIINANFDHRFVPDPSGCTPPDQTTTRDVLCCLLSDTLQHAICNKPFKQQYDDGHTHKSTFMFQCKRVPEMNIKQYFQRFAKYSGVSGEAMILSIVHIARICRTLPNFPVNSLTIHRLLLASLLISAKFFDDSRTNNGRYALLGGVTLKEMNQLEVEFLFLIDFNLFVTESEYTHIYRELVTHNPLKYRPAAPRLSNVTPC